MSDFDKVYNNRAGRVEYKPELMQTFEVEMEIDQTFQANPTKVRYICEVKAPPGTMPDVLFRLALEEYSRLISEQPAQGEG